MWISYERAPRQVSVLHVVISLLRGPSCQPFLLLALISYLTFCQQSRVEALTFGRGARPFSIYKRAYCQCYVMLCVYACAWATFDN